MTEGSATGHNQEGWREGWRSSTVMLGHKQVLSREAALALLTEAVPGTLERSVERQWIMAAREAGAGWGEIEEAINWNPRPKEPGWDFEE